MGNARSNVIRYCMRLVDYGKGGSDPELDGMSMGQVADQIIALATAEAE